MNSFFYTCLFIFWTLFGSFASVLMYSLKSWEKWMLTWSSHCNKCNHTLSFLDLVPVFTFLMNKWKCKYCKDKVSNMYPMLELTTWMLYSFMWYFLMDFSLMLSWDILELSKLIFFLMIWFLTMVYTFYDMLFLEIHEKMLWIWVLLSLMMLSLQTLFPTFQMITFLPLMTETFNVGMYSMMLSLMMMMFLYIVMIKGLKELYDVLMMMWMMLSLYIFKYIFNINMSNMPMLSWITWALGMFMFFFLQMLISSGSWMWWGDLSIAMLMGLMLWMPFSFSGAMITYIMWSVIWLYLVIYTSMKHKKWTTMESEMPFWPFLALGFFTTIFFNNEMWNFMEMYFNSL